MPQGESKATIKIGTEGAGQTVGDLREVDKARKELVQGGTAQTVVTTDMAESQGVLNAAEGDYVLLLSAAHPVLGRLVDVSIKALKVFDNLGKSTASLAGGLALLKTQIIRFAGTLKLLGAVGVVATGFWALFRSIASVVKEAGRAEAVIKLLSKRNTELGRQSAEAAKGIIAERAALAAPTGFRRKPFTFEQEESVQQTLAAAEGEVSGDTLQRLRPILKVLGGAKGFGDGSGEFTGGELEDLARLGFDPIAERSPKSNVRRARSFLRRGQEDRGILEDRDRKQGQAENQRAVEQALSDDEGGDKDLKNVVDAAAERFGLASDDLQERVTRMIRLRAADDKPFGARANEALHIFLRQIAAGETDPSAFTFSPTLPGETNPGRAFRTPDRGEPGTQRALNEIFLLLKRAIDAGMAQPPPPVNVSYQVNNGPDARAFRTRETGPVKTANELMGG